MKDWRSKMEKSSKNIRSYRDKQFEPTRCCVCRHHITCRVWGKLDNYLKRKWLLILISINSIFYYTRQIMLPCLYTFRKLIVYFLLYNIMYFTNWIHVFKDANHVIENNFFHSLKVNLKLERRFFILFSKMNKIIILRNVLKKNQKIKLSYKIK